MNTQSFWGYPNDNDRYEQSDRVNMAAKTTASRPSIPTRMNNCGVAMMPFLLEEDFELNPPSASLKPFVPSYRPSDLQATADIDSELDVITSIKSSKDTFAAMVTNNHRGSESGNLEFPKNGQDASNPHGYGLQYPGRIQKRHGSVSPFGSNTSAFPSPSDGSGNAQFYYHGSRSPEPSPAPSLVSSEYSFSGSGSPFPSSAASITETPRYPFARHGASAVTPSFSEVQLKSPGADLVTPRPMGGSSSAFNRCTFNPSMPSSQGQHFLTPLEDEDKSVYYTPSYGRSRSSSINTSDAQTSGGIMLRSDQPQCRVTSESDSAIYHSATAAGNSYLKQTYIPMVTGAANGSSIPSKQQMKSNDDQYTLDFGYKPPILCGECTPPPKRHAAHSVSVSPFEGPSSLTRSATGKCVDSSLGKPRPVDPVAPTQCTPMRRREKPSRSSVDFNGSPRLTHSSVSPVRSPSSICTSPLPQNLKGDPHRQAKVKTELCLFFSRGTACPFGPRCNYAHGEDELKYTKLVELSQAGLVEDINAYRSHPCFSWVATGACPFGLRCSHFHDPRVAGVNSSWLPHSDVPVTNLQTDLNVDKTHYQSIAALSQKNPLVHNMIWDLRPSLKNKKRNTQVSDADTEWRDTYSLVCNLTSLNPVKKPKDGSFNSTVHKLKMSELQKLCIAIKMSNCSGSNSRIEYVYRPEHVVYNELCMLVQTKYFRLLNPGTMIGVYDIENGSPPIHTIIREISADEYEGSKSFWNKEFPYTPEEVVVVQELAFGCAGEAASRLSLWFDLCGLTHLSAQEIKRFKRTKQRNKASTSNQLRKVTPYPGSNGMMSNLRESSSSSNGRTKAPSSFDTHPHKPFFRMQPASNDPSSFSLIHQMLIHRISVLIQREFRAFRGTESEVRHYVTSQDSKLRETFEQLSVVSKTWKWPVTKGREQVTAETPVPKCSSKYTPTSTATISNIWDGFISAGIYETGASEKQPSRSRLGVLHALSETRSIGKGKTLIPHIESQINRNGNDAWKSIILDSNDHTDWKVIKDHYLEATGKSRDKCMPLSSANGERN